MRTDNLQFKLANEAVYKEPRFVVAIIFDAGSLYITSHSDIANVPGIVLAGALQDLSAISQRLVPDEGRSEIGTFSFSVVDINSDFSDEVKAKLNAGAGLRGKLVRLYVGYRGFDFSAFQQFQTQQLQGCEFEEGVYSVTCEDITRQQRTSICDVVSTTLAASVSLTEAAVINVADTSKFLPVSHGAGWNDAPGQFVYYFKIDKEIIRATGKTGTTFTGLTRGVMNTAAAPHVVDAGTAQERRPKVEEFVYVELPAPKLALAIMTGGIFDGWPANLLGSEGSLQTDSNADGAANGWQPFVGGTADVSRVHVASIVAGSSPFSGNAQRLSVTSVGNASESGMLWSGAFASGLSATCSAYLRTNATGVYLLVRCRDASGAILLDTSSATVAADSIAHLAQLSFTSPARTTYLEVQIRGVNAASEFLEFDNVMFELGSTVHAFTPTRFTVLPEHWHCGITPDLVRIADFTGIGSDLWTLGDDTGGFKLRFEGITKQDGKRFLEREIYLLLGAYSPIYSDGTLGLRRLPAMISDAAPMATLTERELVSVSALKHDYDSLHNVIRVTWGYDIGLGAFTRDTIFLDSTSIGIHGQAPVQEYSFRGLHSGAHTEGMIRKRIDAIRDAYSYPPQRITAAALPSLNAYETGDVFRLKVKNVRDFAGSTTDIDRSFLVLRRSIDFDSGELSFELFGSTLRPEARAPSTEATAPLPDAFYNATGTALNTVIGMTGNTVNVGTHTITGAGDMNSASSIFYHLGDLVIPDGAIINVVDNVQIRARGFITLNGDIVGSGNGKAGVADPGGVLSSPVQGTPGFIGNSRGWDGVNCTLASRLQFLDTTPAALTRAQFDAWPDLNLVVSGTTLKGIPSDLRGTSGGPGGRALIPGGSSTNGGSGAPGGAGLAVVCRGLSFGVSSSITLSGAASATTSPVTISGVPKFPDAYPGAGGAGGPGACLILLDGNSLSVPNFAGRFFARTGVVPAQGVAMRKRQERISSMTEIEGLFAGVSPRAWSGYLDEQLVTDVDLSLSAIRVAYVPSTQTPASNQDQLPGPVTFAVKPGAGFLTIDLSLPPLDSFDVVDIYGAITNDRTGATLVSRGRAANVQWNLPVLATRYLWARSVRVTSSGLERYGDWYPSSSTGGLSATTLNPGGWTPATTAAGSATMLVTSSTIEKSGGSSSWDSQAYSLEKYPACFVSWRANDATHDFMIGLNTDPTTDANYTSLDYAIQCVSDGTVWYIESGGGGSTGLTYDASTTLAITYDGERIRYLRNGATFRTVVAPGLSLALDSSFATPGGKALDVKFGPQGFAGADGAPGTPGATGATGNDGLSIAELAIYLRSASAPSTPTGGSYNFSTQALTSPSGGWASAVPTGNNPVYTSRAVAAITGQTGTDSTLTWSAPVLVLAEGASVDIAFQRSAAQPSTPAASSSTPSGWYSNVSSVPASPYPMWSTIGTRANAGLNWTWQTPVRVEGEEGTDSLFLDTFDHQNVPGFYNLDGGSPTLSYPTDGEFGGRVVQAVGLAQYIWKENVPFDPTALYRITAQVRRTVAASSGGQLCYIGVEGVAADGTTLINEAGGNSTGSQHYNCFRAFDLSAVPLNTWVTATGYFKGLATSGFGVAATNDSPTPMYTGVKYFRPMFILNYLNGNGTQQINFIKIERLITPDDADNTDKRRIVPDPEFGRSTGSEYWWSRLKSASPSVSISLTGGNVDGKATISGNAEIISRRNPAYVLLPGTFYTVSARIRRTSTFSGSPPFLAYLEMGAYRHESDPSVATYSSTNERAGYGSILIEWGTLQSLFVTNQWYEFNGTIWIPPDSTLSVGNSLYLSAYLRTNNFNAGNTVEIDYLNLVPGTASNIQEISAFSSLVSTNNGQFSLYKKVVFDVGTDTFELPQASADFIGGKVFFEQRASGTMTVSVASGSGNTLSSSPGVTGSRNLAGVGAVAYAECISATTWRITGQLA